MGARCKDSDVPGLTVEQCTASKDWEQTCADRRRFSATRRTKDGKKTRGFQLFKQTLNFTFAAKEKLGVFLIKGLQASIRTNLLSKRNRRHRPRRCSLNCMDKNLKAPGIIKPVSKIDPGAHFEKWR